MGENTLVPCVDDTSGPDLERDVEAFEAIALDVCGQLFVPLRLPLQRRRHVGRRVPGNG